MYSKNIGTIVFVSRDESNYIYGDLRSWSKCGLSSRVVLDSDFSDRLDSDSCDNPGDSTLTRLNTLVFLIDNTDSTKIPNLLT